MLKQKKKLVNYEGFEPRTPQPVLILHTDQSDSRLTASGWKFAVKWAGSVLSLAEYIACTSRPGKMDVADRMQSGRAVVRDVLGERTQKLFQDFLEK